VTEQDYDEIIAPMLLEVAKKVNELNGNIVARVEWEPGEGGITLDGDMKNAGIAQYMTFLAAMSKGNIDSMLINLIKEKDVSQSVFLHTHNRPSPTTNRGGDNK